MDTGKYNNPYFVSDYSEKSRHWKDMEDQKRKTDQMHSVVQRVLTEISEYGSIVIQARNQGASDKVISQQEEKYLVPLRTLHELTSSKFRDNRVPMICTTKYDAVGTLITNLQKFTVYQDYCSPDIRRCICLIFNNLSVPYDNKAVLALGPSSKTLIQTLLSIISLNLPEAYLCCICLMNLSRLSDARDAIFYFGFTTSYTHEHMTDAPSDSMTRNSATTTTQLPSRESGRLTQASVLKDPRSLVRTLEKLIRENTPFIVTAVHSVEVEAIRWSFGILRNYTAKEIYCSILSQTSIPHLLVETLRLSPREIIKWTADSVEELALVCLCDIVQWSSGRKSLENCSLSDTMDRIVATGGIHGYRASIITAAVVDS